MQQADARLSITGEAPKTTMLESLLNLASRDAKGDAILAAFTLGLGALAGGVADAVSHGSAWFAAGAAAFTVAIAWIAKTIISINKTKTHYDEMELSAATERTNEAFKVLTGALESKRADNIAATARLVEQHGDIVKSLVAGFESSLAIYKQQENEGKLAQANYYREMLEAAHQSTKQEREHKEEASARARLAEFRLALIVNGIPVNEAVKAYPTATGPLIGGHTQAL